MEKIVKKFNGFEEAEKAEREYWQNISDEERIYNMLYLQQLMLDLYYPDVKVMEKVVTIKKLREKE